jgi:hypothetical protein
MYRDIVTALPPVIPLLFCRYTLDSSGFTLDDLARKPVTIAEVEGEPQILLADWL